MRLIKTPQNGIAGLDTVGETSAVTMIPGMCCIITTPLPVYVLALVACSAMGTSLPNAAARLRGAVRRVVGVAPAAGRRMLLALKAQAT